MCNIQPADLISVLDQLNTANSNNDLELVIGSVVTEMTRLFRTYCRSTICDLSNTKSAAAAPLGMTDNGINFGEIRNSLDCDDRLLLNIKSVHNLPAEWRAKFVAYIVEMNLMYGGSSANFVAAGHKATSAVALILKHGFEFVQIDCMANFSIPISSLPYECQACFKLYGIPVEQPDNPLFGTNQLSAARNVEMLAIQEKFLFELLAITNLPLFNVDRFLVQGPFLLPFRTIVANIDEQFFACFQRPLIRDSTETCLLVEALEFDYQIQFPKEISICEMQWQDFGKLPKWKREQLETIVENVDIYLMTAEERGLLWANRCWLHKFPRALPLLIQSSTTVHCLNLSNIFGKIYAMLQKWNTLPSAVALELLLPIFPDMQVRKKAVSVIFEKSSSEFLVKIIPMLVEALRYEIFENSTLAIFLLAESTRNRIFAFELFWQVQQRIDENEKICPAFAGRCQLLQKLMLREMGIEHFEHEIAQQFFFLEKLDNISTNVKAIGNRNQQENMLKYELAKLLPQLDFATFRIPIAPSFCCTSISIDKCAIFSSQARPIKIMFKGKKQKKFGIIYKAGDDDLRQDAAVIQLINAMNDIWLSKQLDLRMLLFRCLPTGICKGLIELVLNASTLREIQIELAGPMGVYKNDTLYQWLRRHNPSEFKYNIAYENFRRSCAGWCVATYILGIGDRHNDNIMVTKNGQIFHIDFGKYMGDFQMVAGFRRDRVPFVFTPEMAYVINHCQNNSTEHFQWFIDECCHALCLLRNNFSLLLNILRFSCASNIPGIGKESTNFLADNLLLDLDDVQAKVLFTRMLEKTLESPFPRLNFIAHTFAQSKGNQMKPRGEEMNKLSFIAGNYTELEEGRIESILVSSFKEVIEDGGKNNFMYRLLVKRENECLYTEIYRTLDEFREFHIKLSNLFSGRAIIPPLWQSENEFSSIWNGAKQGVAVRRHWDLQFFLQRLLALENEVAHCDLVYTFFHSFCRDMEQRRGPNAMPARGSSCQIFLQIFLDSPNSILRIFVGHAKNLPLVLNEKAPNSYVKIYLNLNNEAHQQQKELKRKTQVIKNTSNPTFNDEFTYDLSNFQMPTDSNYLHSASINVAVWHSGKSILKKKFPLCGCQIHLDHQLKRENENEGFAQMGEWFLLKPALEK